jgi:hypothetical protein
MSLRCYSARVLSPLSARFSGLVIVACDFNRRSGSSRGSPAISIAGVEMTTGGTKPVILECRSSSRIARSTQDTTRTKRAFSCVFPTFVTFVDSADVTVILAAQWLIAAAAMAARIVGRLGRGRAWCRIFFSVSDARCWASERPSDQRQEQGCAQEQLEKPITQCVSPPFFRVVNRHRKRGTHAKNVS